MRRISQQDWENEHMHNPMTEGEALAVLRELRDTGDVSDWQAMESALTMAIDRLTAHTAASGGEVVAWRKRATSVSTGEFFGETPWYDGLPNAADLAQVENANSRGVAHCWIEYAYRAPPAAVPADALERLVEKWRKQAAEHGVRTFTGNDHALFANELAALIPKGEQS